MNIMNCKGCGRLFNVISNSRLCPNCVAALEEKFQEVKKYLYENPNASIDVVSKECEVAIKQIKEWVREERLAFTEGSASGIGCEKCGRMILTGRYCDECRMKIHDNLSSALDKKAPKMPDTRNTKRDHERMRYLKNF